MGQKEQSDQLDFFRPRLKAMLQPDHELVQLAEELHPQQISSAEIVFFDVEYKISTKDYARLRALQRDLSLMNNPARFQD